MLNESKIKMMTKMAIYEKNEGKDMTRNSKYYKTDYVAFAVFKSIITSTIAFIILAAMIVFMNLNKIVEQASSLDYAQIAKVIVIYYFSMIVIFGIISGCVALYQYNQSREGLKKYFSRLSKLERFYKKNNE